MARAPVSIEESAVRRDLPTANFNPQDASPQAFGSAIGRGLQSVGGAVNEMAEVFHKLELAKLEEQRQTEEFNRQTEFVRINAEEAQRLDTEARSVQGDGQGFTEDFMGRSNERFAPFLESIPEARRPAWEARVAAQRGTLSQMALRTEFAVRDAHYGTELTTTLDAGLNTIATDPTQTEMVRANMLAAVEASGLPVEEQDKWRAKIEQSTAFAYGVALGERDPAALISALGGVTIRAGEFRNDGAATPQAKQAVNFFRSNGLSDVATAGVVGVLLHESGSESLNPNARNPGDGAAGDDSIGIGQWNGSRAAALKAFAASRGKPWNDLDTQLAFVLQEMKTSEPEAYRRLQAARTVEDAVEAMSYYERPRGWTNGGDRTAVIHWDRRVAKAMKVAGTRADATDETASPGTDPVLSRLSFDQRMRLRDQANRDIDRAAQQDAVAAQQAQAQAVNQLELNIIDGEAGQAEIDAARANGTLTDASDVNRLQGIIRQREEQTQDFTRFVQATGAGTLYDWNPYSEDDRKAAEAGVAAQGNTPQAGFRVWEQTGILARPAADALRGGLISQDPAKVQASASIAARMLARNPAAFAGVANGREIEEAAALYLRRIELGDSATEAAARVAQSNDPVQRSRVRANDAEATAFRDRIRKKDPIPQILNEINGAGGFLGTAARVLTPGAARAATAPVSAAERGALLADYAELASDHFAQYGDAGAAETFARNRIKAMWGASNDLNGRARIMRYPPEHVYPAVNGSHDWLYSQAAADVKAATGLTVPANRIQFIPLPGRTGDFWRQGKPAPYSIQFVDDNGHIQTLNRQAFVGRPPASAARTSAAETARRAQEFETRRQRSLGADETRNEQIRNPTGPLGIVPGIMTPGT